MATKKKTTEQTKTTDSIMGDDYAEWELTESYTPYDKRKCTNCGFEATFPKDMNDCVWTTCPECGKEMRW